MVDQYKLFVRRLTVISVLLLLISLIIFLWVPKIPITPAFPYIILFFYGFTVFIFRMLKKAKENRLSRFANTFMLVNFSKLLLFIVIILLYAYFNPSDAVAFTITFFIFYIFYTAFEVVTLLKS